MRAYEPRTFKTLQKICNVYIAYLFVSLSQLELLYFFQRKCESDSQQYFAFYDVYVLFWPDFRFYLQKKMGQKYGTGYENSFAGVHFSLAGPVFP